MIYINKYVIFSSATFKKELKEIIYYFKQRLKEPMLAKNFYKNIIKETNSLEFMPERYIKITNYKDKNRNLHRLLTYNYIIIYEVDNDKRTSIYFTYFPQFTKLFKPIIIKSKFFNLKIFQSLIKYKIIFHKFDFGYIK